MVLTNEEVLKFVKAQSIEMVDLKVVDLCGRWHHITIPANQLSKSTFTDGIGIDASSYPGYKKVASGDMRIIPDNSTINIDPFHDLKTLSIGCDILDSDNTPYQRYPRNVAKKAEQYLASTQKKIGLFSPELEFSVFDELRYSSGINQAFYYLDSTKAFWNTGRQENPNLGYKFASQAGYHGIPPADSTFNLRSKLVKLIEESGIPVKYHHHEVGAAQVEIEVPHNTLLASADAVMLMKYLTKNIAYQSGKVATFMPKPLYEQAGNGMHVHQYLSDGKISLFYDKDGYAGLNQLALNYIGGLLKHGPALLAFTSPSTNSYKRLIPGYEAPVNLFYAAANRTAAVRIPMYDIGKQRERIEFRPPDATCNPYLALSAMLMAGLDGIENKIDPAVEGFGPFDIDIAEMSEQERATIKALPSSLQSALDALRDDHDFLLKGEVFTEDLIGVWIEYKLSKEVNPLQARPHPYEFELYSDI
ncbi:MAG: type I glutamate--ammonia ligase [Chloroflexota bacterium]|nr:MAG: type I glutamate--ammonia ligase [Chloroflexota bacterium]